MSKKCPVCKKSVYPMEEVQSGGQSYHKITCFKCQMCKKTLEKGKEINSKEDNMPYCPTVNSISKKKTG